MDEVRDGAKREGKEREEEERDCVLCGARNVRRRRKK